MTDFRSRAANDVEPVNESEADFVARVLRGARAKLGPRVNRVHVGDTYDHEALKQRAREVAAENGFKYYPPEIPEPSNPEGDAL
jgi:hypothetical protein